METILTVFKGEDLRIDPTLQTKLPTPVIARHPELNKETAAFKGTVPDLRPLKEVIRGVESGLSPKYD